MRLQTPGRRFAKSLMIMAIGALFAAPALADEIVYFVNGKAMMVQKVEKGPEFTILEIQGGGRIGVPNAHITRIEPYQVSAPRPAGSTARRAGNQGRTTPKGTPAATPGGATRQEASPPRQTGSVAQGLELGRVPGALNSQRPAMARGAASRGSTGGRIAPPRAGPGGRFTGPREGKLGPGANRKSSRGRGSSLRGGRRSMANRRSGKGGRPRTLQNPRNRPTGGAVQTPSQAGAAATEADQETPPPSDGPSSEEN
jgi:hypothetical protein